MFRYTLYLYLSLSLASRYYHLYLYTFVPLFVVFRGVLYAFTIEIPSCNPKLRTKNKKKMLARYILWLLFKLCFREFVSPNKKGLSYTRWFCLLLPLLEPKLVVFYFLRTFLYQILTQFMCLLLTLILLFKKNSNFWMSANQISYFTLLHCTQKSGGKARTKSSI